MTSLPNLSDYAAVLSWASEQEAAGRTPLDVAEVYAAEGSALGRLRAALSAQRAVPCPAGQVRLWLREAYLEGDETVRIMARALSIHYDVALPISQGGGDRVTSQGAVQVLNDLLRQLADTPATPLRLEAELRIYHALLQAHRDLQDVQKMDEVTAQLVFLASMIGHERLRDHYQLVRADAMLYSGRFHQGVTVLQRLVGRPQASGLEAERLSLALMAPGLTNLGGGLKALDLLQRTLSDFHADPVLAFWQQWIRAVHGLEHPDNARLHDGGMAARYGWQVDAMKTFAAVEGLLPVGKALVAREAALRRVVALATPATGTDMEPSDLLFGRWIRSRARLLLGEYGLALKELEAVPPAGAEDLLNRVLLSGLAIETAMTPLERLDVPLREAEDQLRQAFDLARGLPYAEPQVLAQLLCRWHPQAAAYGALMPNPIPECLPALDLVMRLGGRTTWRGQVVPISLVPNLIRLGLRLGMLPVATTGNVLYQASRLLSAQDPVPVWGPVVPALPLAVALLRGGAPHRLAAQRAIADFGLAPAGAEDPLGLLAAIVERAARGEHTAAVWRQLAAM